MQIPTGPPGEGPGDIPRPELSCDSQACRAALVEVANNRNRVLLKCSQVAATRSRMLLMAGIAGFFFTLTVGLLAAAASATSTFFGIPAGIVLFVAAMVALALALLFTDLRGHWRRAACRPTGRARSRTAEIREQRDRGHGQLPVVLLGRSVGPTLLGVDPGRHPKLTYHTLSVIIFHTRWHIHTSHP